MSFLLSEDYAITVIFSLIALISAIIITNIVRRRKSQRVLVRTIPPLSQNSN